MKKVSILVLMVITLGAMAQRPSFEKGDQAVNLSVGFGNALYSGSWYKTTVPAIAVSYEKGIIDNFLNDAVIGVGGYLGYSAYKWEYNNNAGWGYKYSDFILAGRGTFHYPFVDKLDTYAGILIGFEIRTEKTWGTTSVPVENDLGSPFILSPFVGARYYFTDNIAAMAEVGYGVAYFNLGVAYKF